MELATAIIGKKNSEDSNIWRAIKARVLYLMGKLGSVPEMNKIPIEKALNRIPPKVFAIQCSSALQESIAFDKQVGLTNMLKHNIPVMILKSDKDGIAKFVPRLYKSTANAKIVDVTNPEEKDGFREHLYHMIEPEKTAKIIGDFVDGIEGKKLANVVS
jgi:hypothetical protein